MKTYSAKKEIKIMGIAMIIFGFVLLFADLHPIIKNAVAIALMAYGLMHVFKLERFK